MVIFIDEGVNENYNVNDDSKEVAMITGVTVGIIGLFIVFSGYLLIYNIMYIAVTKDINFYGLIKTIGTSPKQIKKIVKGQALRLSIIGIPLGLILGALVSFGVVPIAIESFSSGTYYSGAMPGDISFSPLVFIGTILFSLFINTPIILDIFDSFDFYFSIRLTVSLSSTIFFLLSILIDFNFFSFSMF